MDPKSHTALAAARYCIARTDATVRAVARDHFSATLANGCPLTLDELLDDLSRVACPARRSPALLRASFVNPRCRLFLRPDFLLFSITYAVLNR